MPRRFISLLALLLLWAAFPCHAAALPGVVAKGKRATALVQTGDDEGSAFCIDASGLFVTNEHVIHDAAGARLTIALNPGEQDQKVVPARVVRTDAEHDLALLKIATTEPLTALELGSIDGLYETMAVGAFGFPFGNDLALHKNELPGVTVSTGHITALRKTQGALQQIQLDASLNPGNSGGPVLDEQGRVIGIVAAGIPGAGVNFAIPVDQLERLLSKPGEMLPSA